MSGGVGFCYLRNTDTGGFNSWVNNLFDINVTDNSTISMFPIETGTKIMDNKVLNPVTITCKFALELASDQASSIQKILEDAADDKTTEKLFTIYTKSNAYENMNLVDISHDENSDQYDLIFYKLKFVQVMFASTEIIPRSAADTNTKPSGNKTGSSTTNPSILLTR